MVDFRSTPDGFEWLDAFGQRAADQVLANREAKQVVVGHADWYAGNTAVVDGALVGTFDWELVADTEAVIAGFAASCYASSPTGGGGLSTPEEVAAFLRDYENVRTQPFSACERRAAAAAAAWILAFNARWQVALIGHNLCHYATKSHWSKPSGGLPDFVLVVGPPQDGRHTAWLSWQQLQRHSAFRAGSCRWWDRSGSVRVARQNGHDDATDRVADGDELVDEGLEIRSSHLEGSSRGGASGGSRRR